MAFDWDSWLFNQAVHYLAKHAASERHVADILARKTVRKLHRKLGAEGFPDYRMELPEAITDSITACVRRCVDLGYISDADYGRMRLNALRAKGWPSRRISHDLIHKGLSADLVQDLLNAEDNDDDRDQDFVSALTYARRRGFGPFLSRSGRQNSKPRDKQIRDKQIQAMQRAGHSYTVSARIIDAEDEESLFSEA